MAHSEVILTESIPNLGAEADRVRVRRGYARNFLIPQGKALEVNPSSLRTINHLKAKRAEREARELTAAEEIAAKINKLNLVFSLETGETGKAFGSVTSKDVQDRLARELPKVELPKHAVELDKAIKETGDQQISIKLHPDVTAKLRISVTTPRSADSEKASDQPAQKSSRKKPHSKS